jgi:molecular chaperone DnaJ
MASGCLKTIQYMKKKAGKSIATKLEVKVPPGVKDGQRLKLKGEGDSSAPPFSFTGDLYVVVKQRPHLIFTRVDNNVLLDLPVSFVDALLGKSLNVLTLSGKVKIQLPPGTPSGKTLRLKGKGFPDINGNESGDMLVTIQIDIPEKLTKKEQEIIEKLSYLNQECPLLSDYTKKVEQLEKDRL